MPDESKNLHQKVDALEKLFNERFDKNDEAHQRLLYHQEEMDKRIQENTNWRHKNQEFIETLKQERQSNKKIFLSNIARVIATFIATIIGVLLSALLGVKYFL